MQLLQKTQLVMQTLEPYVVAAGDYATAIQARVASQPAKGSAENPFYDALTDADLSVQGFIEVALLAAHPDIAFHGEEYASSLNMKYFDSDAELTVFLDPIDGTRFYADNLDTFNVIVTIASKTEIMGAMLYMPRLDIFLSAVKGGGLRWATRDQMLDGVVGLQQSLQVKEGVVVTYNFPELANMLSPSLHTIDVLEAYVPGKGCVSINALFLGDCAGIIGKGMSIIDWGAMAFLAGEAGAIVSDFNGNPIASVDALDNYTYPEIVVALNSATHEKIIAAGLC